MCIETYCSTIVEAAVGLQRGHEDTSERGITLLDVVAHKLCPSPECSLAVVEVTVRHVVRSAGRVTGESVRECK